MSSVPSPSSSPPHPAALAGHDLRSALTVALTRAQLAHRRLSAGRDGVDPLAELAEIKTHLRRAIAVIEAWEAAARG